MGGASSDPDFSQIEYLKNWHWMWSKFYYHHKHDSYLYAFIKIFKSYLFFNIIHVIHTTCTNKSYSLTFNINKAELQKRI